VDRSFTIQKPYPTYGNQSINQTTIIKLRFCAPCPKRPFCEHQTSLFLYGKFVWRKVQTAITNCTTRNPKKALHYFLSLAPTQRCIYFSSAETPPILTSILLKFRRLLPVACTCLLRHINNIFLLALNTSFYPVLTPLSMPPSRRSEHRALQSLAIRTLAQWTTNSATN
jgi:hypothetical protein